MAVKISSWLILLGALLSLAPRVSDAALVTVAAMGDSITQGGNNGAGGSFTSYRAPLWGTHIVGDNFDTPDDPHHIEMVGPFTNFHNMAGVTDPHAGWWGAHAFSTTASSYLSQLTNYNPSFDLNSLLRSPTDPNPGVLPNIAMLHIGLNDIRKNEDGSTTDPTNGGTDPSNNYGMGNTIETTKNEVASIIGALQAANPDIFVLLAEIGPMIPDTELYDVNAGIEDYNDLLRNLADNDPGGQIDESRVWTVDMWSAFVDDNGTPEDTSDDTIDPNGLMLDRFHPNAMGDAEMASRWWHGTGGQGLRSLTVEASMAQVPEPSACLLVGLIGFFAGTRRWFGQLHAT